MRSVDKRDIGFSLYENRKCQTAIAALRQYAA
jgi:hypothetical protein